MAASMASARRIIRDLQEGPSQTAPEPGYTSPGGCRAQPTSARSSTPARYRYGAWGLVVVLLIVWAHRFWAIYQDWGLFAWLGNDFGFYWVQGVTWRTGGATAIYDLERTGQALQALGRYTRPELLQPGPVAYPPLFAALFSVFTLLDPPWAFAIWEALSILGVAGLAFRVGQLLPVTSRTWLFCVLLTSAPFAMALFNGQPVVLLALAWGECYLSLRAGREFRAGLWLGVLFLKPQYGLVLGAILLVKRRWAAVSGAAVVVGAILLGSALAVGLPTLASYPSVVAEQGGFYGAAQSAPRVMINWRAFVLELRPTIREEFGIALTVLLSSATVALLVPTWRGPWNTASARFPVQFACATLVTLLALYYSNPHGAVLLAVPFASVVALAGIQSATRALIVASIFVFTLVPVVVIGFVWGTLIQKQPVDVIHWAPLAPVLLAACLVALTREAIRLQPAARGSSQAHSQAVV